MKHLTPAVSVRVVYNAEFPYDSSHILIFIFIYIIETRRFTSRNRVMAPRNLSLILLSILIWDYISDTYEPGV